MSEEYLAPELEANFPNLRRGEYEKTSKNTAVYNCIAYAAEDESVWWWPDHGVGIYWPVGVSQEETIESFVHAYGSIGYVVCDDGCRNVEAGFQKIAIYVDDDGVPSHAARQLPSGCWTSKLGKAEDIRHNTLEAIESDPIMGLGYGKVALIMRRPAVEITE